MYRPGIVKALVAGILIGLVVAPMVWFGAITTTSAQALPFTPTPEPTELPTEEPPTTVPTASPTNTPQPTPQPIVIIATPTTSPVTATPQPTAAPGYGRDVCDPNHTLHQPCALATETDVANLNFNDGTSDVFSFLLKGGRQYRISAIVASIGGIDPAIELFSAGNSDRLLASNDDEMIGSPSAVLTTTVQNDEWYILRVSNKAPGSTVGKTYTLSARSVAAVGDASKPKALYSDDPIGNAYDFEHAARLVWNTPYDLSMVCPDAATHACYAGRHIFAVVPIKQQVPFTALTYNLGSGVDTVLTLYKPDPTQTETGPGLVSGWRAVAANDDVAPGWTLRSQVSVLPDWSGSALLVIAPSNREDLPLIPAEGRTGRYHLIVGSPELPNVKAALAAAEQDLPPTPEPTALRPTSQPAPAALGAAPASTQDTREVIREACPTGHTVVGTEETGLYAAAPPAADDRIAAYPQKALVALLGECYRGWVKVQPADSVTPGWMWGPDLRPEALDTPSAAQDDRTPSTSAQEPIPTRAIFNGEQNLQATPVSLLPKVAVAALEPSELPTTIPTRPIARMVTVEVCRAEAQDDVCAEPIANLRVDLQLAATHQVLTGNRTDIHGVVTLSVSVLEGSKVLLVIPALGIETPLETTINVVPVRVLGGGV